MKYYCIGIKGTGMSTLAQILYDLGNEVSGYDDAKDYKFTQKGLDDRNIKIYYDNEHEIDKDTIVTHSVAFKDDHKEIKRVKEMGLTIKKYSEIVGEVIDLFDTISVAGTHGKTTTSSLMRRILEDSYGCNYFVGAGDGKVSLDNKYFVIESDEFNKHFLYYHPKYAIITNMEEEHMECYSDLDDIIDSFSTFADQTKEFVVACGDNLNVRKIKTKTKMYYYGFNDDNDIIIKNCILNDEGALFDVYYEDNCLGHFSLPLFGRHMVLNATAAIFMGYKLNVDINIIIKSLSNFKNAARRFALEEYKDTIIIDDYAHHPTEIKATLMAVRQKYPNRKVVAVFKPNTYSRTKDFKDDFVSSLSIADKVYITEIESNRERQEDYPGICSNNILENIQSSVLINDDNDLINLKNEAGNVICFMSCASINHLIDNFKKEI